MADILTAITGGGSRQKQGEQTLPDPVAQSMNQMRFDQLRTMFERGGGAPAFAGAMPDIFSMTGDESRFRGQAMNQAGTPGMGTQDWLTSSMQMVSPAAGSLLSNITAPAIQNQMSLAGLGRSGAGTEALARAGMEMALPMAMQLSQQMPQADIALRGANLDRMMTGMNLGAIPRQLAQEDILRRQGLMTTGLTGIPFTPGSSSKQTGEMRQKSIFEGMFKQ
jgi:hypothetical protein